MNRSDFVTCKKRIKLGSKWRLNKFGKHFNRIQSGYSPIFADDITISERIRSDKFNVEFKNIDYRRVEKYIYVSDLEVFYEQI